MQATVRVAAIQMAVAWLEPAKNAERMAAMVRQVHAEHGSQLIVFPELANTGYLTGRDREFARRYALAAEAIPGPTTETIGAAARAAGVYVVVGMCEAGRQIPGTMSNAAVLIGPRGAVEGVHRKVHIPGEEKHYFHPGGTTDVSRTELGTLGLQVCADLRFPELSRIQALRGAEILCCAFSKPKNRRGVPDSSLPNLTWMAYTRAIENLVYAIVANRVGQEGDLAFDGRSVIVGPTGAVLAESPSEEAEEILVATLDGELLLEERAYNPVFRDRQPPLYRPISELY
jgi:predicted amidohydrolase